MKVSNVNLDHLDHELIDQMFNVCIPEMSLNDKGKSTLLDGNFKIQRNIVDDHHRKKKMAIFKSMAQRSILVGNRDKIKEHFQTSV